jgi:cell division septum initiation protein DivIVA
MMQNGTDPDSLAAAPVAVSGMAPGDAPDASPASAPDAAAGTPTEEGPANGADTSPENALSVAVNHLPDTRSVDFTMKVRGGAYDRLEVDTFLSQLAQAIAEVRTAASAAGQEIATLRAENARLGSSGPDSEDEITAGAVGLLTQAQLIADKAIADAEQYARDLVLTARNQYREILERAENTASQASATLNTTTPQGPPVPEIEYVRTYAQVAQIQLRSVLDALTEQVDRLGSLPQPTDSVEEPENENDDESTGEPEWQPSS